MKLKGFTIFVSDIYETSEFYSKLFKKSPYEKGNNSCTFMFGMIKFFIHKKGKWDQGMPPNEDHVEFEVDDLNKEIARLKRESFILEIEPKEYYWGTSAYLRDPEGRLIELIQKEK